MKSGNKKLLISLAGAALLSIGLTNVGQQNNAAGLGLQTVQAAKKTYKIKLKHNSYVYNKRGKRKGKKILRKGQVLTAFSQVKIKGKKYYRLTKGRYVKAANTAKYIDSKELTVNLIKDAPVYNGKGQLTGKTLKKGLNELVHGTTTIKGKKYYVLKGNHYISADTAKIITDEASRIKPNTQPNIQKPSAAKPSDDKPFAGPGGEPNQEQIKALLRRGAVYFSKEDLAQIQRLLWQKIQNYRISKGYQPYKSHTELDGFANKVVSDSTGLYQVTDMINSGYSDQLMAKLPILSKNGMTKTRKFDLPDFYSYSLLHYQFDIKDRNIEHVANAIFKYLQTDFSQEIEGRNDKEAFGTLVLSYYFNGDHSSMGLMFIEVAGNSSQWTNYYNAN